ncbi:MAG: HAD family acid phosphatase [Bauldia sp.]
MIRKLPALRCAVLVLVLAAGALPAAAADPVPQNDLLNATLWVSNAVEYKANTLGAFALARIRLDEALADKTWTATGQAGAFADLPPAIIADVDETLLDNGGYESWLVVSGQNYSSKSYDAWTKAMEARAVPGAVDFAKYADSKGVKVFYVTNRNADQEDQTRKNMEALGFPMGGNVDTFLMQKEKEDWGSKKSTRRDFIAKDYRVLLLLGDNYGDFSDDFAGTEAERLASFEKNKDHFTKDWITIANPEYGSFECAPYKCDFKLPDDDKRKLKIDALPAWKGPPPN